MPAPRDPLAALRAAVEHSPDNVPLREHLAQELLAAGQALEAEGEFRRALQLAPRSGVLKLGLAQAFFQQGKRSESLVVLESLLREQDCPAGAYVLSARLLYQNGDIPQAVANYKLGIETDPTAGDDELAERLGIHADESSQVDEGRLRIGVSGGGDTAAEGYLEQPTTAFADVGGMEALKEEIRLKIIYPLKHPEMYAAYGKKIGGGILMYGPPGCGKTHLARATAGEISASFLSVGISDVLDMWIGRSERNLQALFEQARDHRPCVLFFDEVDALGARRSDMGNSGARQLINQFLSEMDGLGHSNEGLLILAATNAPWHLDPAFRRPGRFDRILFVPPPDQPARASILRILCTGKPQQNIDFDQLAKKTVDFSGADLKGLVDTAIEAKLQQAFREGIPKPLTTADLLQAAKDLRPTTKEWFGTAKNYALYANQGGAYDDILKYLKM